MVFFSVNLYGQDFSYCALTPPMGWNSWDCYGPTVTEQEVKANADYMARYLKQYGWEYIVIDIRWYVENSKAHGYNQEDPMIILDDYGRLLPAVNRFPSAADSKGFKPLADYAAIHAETSLSLEGYGIESAIRFNAAISEAKLLQKLLETQIDSLLK